MAYRRNELGQLRWHRRYLYDSSGSVVESNDLSGCRTLTPVDALGRTTSQQGECRWGVDHVPSKLIEFTYDDPEVDYSAGRLTAVRTPAFERRYAFGPGGLLAVECNRVIAAEVCEMHQYDAWNRVEATRYTGAVPGPNRAVELSYSRDGAGRITRTAYDDGGPSTYAFATSWNAYESIESLQVFRGDAAIGRIDSEFDAEGRVRLRRYADHKPYPWLETARYSALVDSRDAAGRMTSISDDGVSKRYEYDHLGRVTSSFVGGTAGITLSETFDYSEKNHWGTPSGGTLGMLAGQGYETQLSVEHRGLPESVSWLYRGLPLESDLWNADSTGSIESVTYTRFPLATNVRFKVTYDSEGLPRKVEAGEGLAEILFDDRRVPLRVREGADERSWVGPFIVTSDGPPELMLSFGNAENFSVSESGVQMVISDFSGNTVGRYDLDNGGFAEEYRDYRVFGGNSVVTGRKMGASFKGGIKLLELNVYLIGMRLYIQSGAAFSSYDPALSGLIHGKIAGGPDDGYSLCAGDPINRIDPSGAESVLTADVVLNLDPMLESEIRTRAHVDALKEAAIAAVSLAVPELLLPRLAQKTGPLWNTLRRSKIGAGASDVARGLPPLRQQYIDSVSSLAEKVPVMREAGMSSEQIAKILHAERRALGVQFKNLTQADRLADIHARNIRLYGDKLGPSVDWLRQAGKSWDDIIESATRAGGKDLGF